MGRPRGLQSLLVQTPPVRERPKCCPDIESTRGATAQGERARLLFDRTVDKVPHLVRNWDNHGMRYEWQALAQFTKDWKSMPHLRGLMLSKPIQGPPGDPTLAYIAATVHALCLRDNWEIPEWVHRFVAKDLFTGRVPPDEWHSDKASLAALKTDLDPVGQRHNVILGRLSCI